MADGLNWQEVYARLEQTRQAPGPGQERPPEAVKRILRERAQALARPRDEVPTPTEVLDLLIFSLAGERYGIETAYVLEAIPLRELTPVPCTPSFVLGVVNHRGRILPLLDFRLLLDLPGQGMTQDGRVVVVDVGGMSFGIFADALVGTMRIGAHEVTPPRAALTGNRQGFIRGVTGEMVAVLDMEVIARDLRIMVNEEVG